MDKEKEVVQPSPYVDSDDPTSGLYLYKGNFYVVLGTVLMKDPQTRKWIEAISYRKIESRFDAAPYVREAKDFFSKFKKN